MHDRNGYLNHRPDACHLYVRNHRRTGTYSDTSRYTTGLRRTGPHSRVNAASGPFVLVVAGVGFEPT
jgi:hypothetical protein